MVYLGPSRGCQTCKRRKKKCDEGRPSCMRCIKANRTCGGYEDGLNIVFPPQDAAAAAAATHPGSTSAAAGFTTIARKCSLPPRSPAEPAVDLRPKEMTEDEVEDLVLRAFVYDYCISSVNRSASRGYLHNLERMIHRSGFQSDLAKACMIVAFAGHGISKDRPRLTRRAEDLYQDLLASTTKAIADPAVANTTDFLARAMLLGLYEMVVASDSRPGDHCTHAQGIAAILGTSISPLAILHAVRTGHPSIQKEACDSQSLFCLPGTSEPYRSLDDLLLILWSLWEKVKMLSASPSLEAVTRNYILDELIALEELLKQWQTTRAEEFCASTVGQIDQPDPAAPIEVGSYPGRIDSYFDLYTAVVWNTYRTARLLLIQLMVQLSGTSDDEAAQSRKREAAQFAEDIIHSVPFHLADDMQDFLQDLGEPPCIKESGRHAGGLLLMHPLFVATNLSVVPKYFQDYMRQCLEWIGVHMGIGQAAVLARKRDIDEQYLASGLMIVWAGFAV